MSLITRCPACSTLFKVVPDQLRVAQGWVRCGQCGEMFVAAAHALSPEEAERVQAPPTAPELPADRAAALMAELPDLDIEAPAADVLHEDGPPPAAVVEPAAPVDDPAPRVDAGPPLEVATMPWPSEVIESEPGPSDAAMGSPAWPAGAPFLAVDGADGVAAARPRRRWLAWVAGVLAVALALQILIDRRDTLAAHWPALTPVLTTLCQPVACRVAPPRQLDAVVIESSNFQRLQADRFRLSASVRNRAEWVVAMPAIELTLTDAQDQPLLRRVLSVQELGGAAALPARAEFNLARELQVSAPVDASAVAGYKLLLFHP